MLLNFFKKRQSGAAGEIRLRSASRLTLSGKTPAVNAAIGAAALLLAASAPAVNLALGSATSLSLSGSAPATNESLSSPAAITLAGQQFSVNTLGGILSIQQVEVTIAAGATSGTQAINSVSSKASIHSGGYRTSNHTVNYSTAASRCELTSPTLVTAYRNSSDASASVVHVVTVIDWDSGWVDSVQHGTITLTAQTSNTATVTSAPTSQSVVCWLGQTSNQAGSNPAQSLVGIAQTNATTLTATKGSATNNATVGYCLIKFNSAKVSSVQAVNIALSTGVASNTASITTVGANAVLFYGGGYTAATTAIRGHTIIRRNSTSQCTAERSGVDNTGTANALGTVLDFASGTVLERVADGTSSWGDRTVGTYVYDKTWANFTGVYAISASTLQNILGTVKKKAASTTEFTSERGNSASTGVWYSEMVEFEG